MTGHDLTSNAMQYIQAGACNLHAGGPNERQDSWLMTMQSGQDACLCSTQSLCNALQQGCMLCGSYTMCNCFCKPGWAKGSVCMHKRHFVLVSANQHGLRLILTAWVGQNEELTMICMGTMEEPGPGSLGCWLCLHASLQVPQQRLNFCTFRLSMLQQRLGLTDDGCNRGKQSVSVRHTLQYSEQRTAGVASHSVCPVTCSRP